MFGRCGEAVMVQEGKEKRGQGERRGDITDRTFKRQCAQMLVSYFCFHLRNYSLLSCLFVCFCEVTAPVHRHESKTACDPKKLKT